MRKEIYVVASEEEKTRLVPKEKWDDCLVTGVGYANVFRALKDVPRDTRIRNVGYAGSNKAKIGAICEVSRSRNYHPNCEFKHDPEYVTEAKRDSTAYYTCYTSGDFVLSTEIEETVVFDMELYAIFAMGFEHVSSEKFITDNLSEKEYEKNTGGNRND